MLLYHSVSTNPSPLIAPFTATPAAFETHLNAAVASGRRCLTVSQLIDAMPDIEDDVVVITFDDGYLNTLDTAAPALAKRGLAFTVYVTSGLLGGKGKRAPGPSDPMMDWSQLEELESMGAEMGAHSHTHPYMDTLDNAALIDELRRPKAMLEDQLGHPIRSFAYPHGYCGPRVRQATRAEGYDSGAGVRNALSHPGDDPFNIARLTVTSRTTAVEVEKWLSGTGAPLATANEALTTTGSRWFRRTKALMTGRPGSKYA